MVCTARAVPRQCSLRDPRGELPPRSTRAPAAGGPLVAAAVALRRPAAQVHDRPARGAALGGRLLARLDALGRLLVEQRSLARGPAALGGRSDDHGPAYRAGRDLEPVAWAELAARLDRPTVPGHAAALHGLGGERSRLHEPSRPEPPVDAHGIVHASILTWTSTRRTGPRAPTSSRSRTPGPRWCWDTGRAAASARPT